MPLSQDYDNLLSMIATPYQEIEPSDLVDGLQPKLEDHEDDDPRGDPGYLQHPDPLATFLGFGAQY
jgi:hypothetical protein